jgi:competence protein ComEC
MKRIITIILTLLLLLILFAGYRDGSAPAVDRPLSQTIDQKNDTGTDSDGAVPDFEVKLPEVDRVNGDTPGSPESESPQVDTSAKLKVHFIDVGQGDAILIQTPSKNVLIDGGERGTTVVEYLKKQGIGNLDLVIGTHPHADHIGGLINVFETIPVKEVIDPCIIHTTKTFEDYLTLIDKKDIIFTEGRAGMTRDLGDGAALLIVHPSSPVSSHINDASIVVRVTFGQVSFLFTGDVEQSGEEEILKRGYDLKSTVLKVGHHGSNTSTTLSFLNAISPEAAVIMVGKANRYGHPHEETLVRLINAKIDIYRTDIHGTLVITSDGQTFEVNQKQPYQYNPPKEPEPVSVPL